MEQTDHSFSNCFLFDLIIGGRFAILVDANQCRRANAMPNPEPKYVVTVRRGHGCLPIDLKFVGLARSQGVETIRIRFSLDRDKLLDLPLSAEALAALVQPLSSLHGLTPAQLPDELEHLRLCGGVMDA